MPKTQPKSARKPRILITAQDMEILESMVGRSATRNAAINLLEDELARAVLVNEDFNTRPFCRIGSRVTYEDLSSGQIRDIQLVLPSDADIDQQRVSVLSLVGASLLGLVADAEFGWTDDNGRPHKLRVLKVEDQKKVEDEQYAQLE
ncbi:MAG: GreA/GreB family elongation factor [Brevundimonas sp.]|nr:GreA/GreB family elongation factor [Brevundimonas sp.]